MEYEKNGRTVYDSSTRDPTGGTVPTHFADRISERLQPGQTVEDLEREVLDRSPEEFGAKEYSRDLSDLDSDVVAGVEALLLQAQKAGHRLTINETYRSQDRQDWLFQQGRSRGGNLVTWTLTSDHSSGRALDLRAPSQAGYDWLQDNAQSLGFTVLGKMDQGHISMQHEQ